MKDELQKRLARAIAKFFTAQKKRVIEQVEGKVITLDGEFWNDERALMLKELKPLLLKAYMGGAEATTQQIFWGKSVKAIASGDLTGMVNEEALIWVSEYGYELVMGLTDRTRAIVENALMQFISVPGATMQDLIDLMGSGFSPSRAQSIAVTETTRAYAQAGEKTAGFVRETGVEFDTIWITNNDAIVAECPICFPRHRKKEGTNWFDTPPAHPNCRCWLVYEIVT